jgi:hypothetical protein
MKYFKQLPNIQYTSVFKDTQSNTDVTLAKNLFKRAKLSNEIKNAVTAFEYYYINNNERPDQVAEKVYGNSELDWVVLTTNNITNIRNQWPLETNSLQKYVFDKYGSEEKLDEIHHYETLEKRDEFNRIVVPKGLQVDPSININILTGIGVTNYQLPTYLNEKSDVKVSVNLNQRLVVKKRTNEEVEIIITDNQIDRSFFKISNTQVRIVNDLNQWPASWGGIMRINRRLGIFELPIDDIIFDNDIIINNNLYEIITVDGIFGPVFKLTEQV